MRRMSSIVPLLLTCTLTACSSSASSSAASVCDSAKALNLQMQDMLINHIANGTEAIDDPAYLTLKVEYMEAHEACTGEGFGE